MGKINELHLEELRGKKRFLEEVGDVLSENPGMQIWMVTFEAWYNEKTGHTQEWMKVVFWGGGYSIRNVNINSNSANFRELGQLIDGGYYDEVKDYEKFQKNAESEGYIKVV